MLSIDTLQDLLKNTSDNVLSLYLYIDPGYQANQSNTPAWRISLKNALKAVRDSADEYTTAKIEGYVNEFFENYSPASKSLVLFVNESGIAGTFELPIAIENYHHFGEIDVVKLLWSVDEYEPYLVVLVDSEYARFMSAYPGSTTTTDEMRLDFEEYDFRNKRFITANHSSGAEGLQGSGGDNFEDMKDEHIRRFHKDVAEQIYDLAHNTGITRIILAGTEQASHQVHDLLHESVKKHVVNILQMQVQSSEAEVINAIRDDVLNYEQSQEMKLVDGIIAFAKSGGRGVLGIEDVKTLLEHQQVELLILSYPMNDEQLARELTVQAITGGVKVKPVHGSAAARLHAYGEVAARLYYAVPQA